MKLKILMITLTIERETRGALEEETSKDFKKKKTIDLHEYKATGNQVQIFKNGHEVINPREKLRCEALEGVQAQGSFGQCSGPRCPPPHHQSSHKDGHGLCNGEFAKI